MTLHSPITLPDLERRLSRKIETGKGIQLSPAELDLLVVSGAIGTLKDASALASEPVAFPHLTPICDDCRKSAPSWIYLIQSGEIGPIKIGFTTKPRERLWALQQANYGALRYIALFRGSRRNEQELHHFYRREHLRGEWFRASERLIAFGLHRGVEQ